VTVSRIVVSQGRQRFQVARHRLKRDYYLLLGLAHLRDFCRRVSFKENRRALIITNSSILSK